METRAYIYICICIPLTVTVQVIQVFLPDLPPLRKGFTRKRTHTVGVSQGYETHPKLWLCKLSSSLIVEQPRSVQENTIPQVFSVLMPLLFSLYHHSPRHSALTAGCLIACVHTECFIRTFESNLIAFIIVIIIICHLAVGLHNYIFRFSSFSFLCFVAFV